MDFDYELKTIVPQVYLNDLLISRKALRAQVRLLSQQLLDLGVIPCICPNGSSTEDFSRLGKCILHPLPSDRPCRFDGQDFGDPLD
jgi:hypothetical protein